MIGQYYLERHFARGSSRRLTARQLRELAREQTRQQGAAGAR
jgi:polar amino acid transport system permease protein